MSWNVRMGKDPVGSLWMILNLHLTEVRVTPPGIYPGWLAGQPLSHAHVNICTHRYHLRLQ